MVEILITASIWYYNLSIEIMKLYKLANQIFETTIFFLYMYNKIMRNIQDYGKEDFGT